MPIDLPPLSERGNDVLILAKHFADDFAKQNKMGAITIAQDAKNKLMNYNFPGNIRELKAIMDLSVVMCDNNEIKANDITFNSTLKGDLFIAGDKTLREHTIEIIKAYLKRNNSDVVLTAQALDIGKSTIYKMMQTGELE